MDHGVVCHVEVVEGDSVAEVEEVAEAVVLEGAGVEDNLSRIINFKNSLDQYSLYLEWVAVEADLDHAKRSLEKNREEVDLEVESVNEVEIVKIDRDQGIGIEKIVIVIAIDEAAVVIGKNAISLLRQRNNFLVNEMIKDHLQKVPERIQFVGSKSLQNQDNHLIEKLHLEKLLYYFEKMLFLKLQKTFDSYALCKKVF